MDNEIITGDVRETLPELPESSVHMCMTSPPYYGLRNYQEDEQIGLEESLDEYISELVGVGDALRRVLRDDGSWWLNLGDTYGGDSIVRDEGDWKRPGDEGYEEDHTASYGEGRRGMSELGRKNKMLVPHRVAIALQSDGWVVRNDVTWVKPNPMPQSVKDRLNTTTEQIFHLTPQPDYWYDLDAIREPHEQDNALTKSRGAITRDGKPLNHNAGEPQAHPAGKNPGDVFEVTTKPFPDAHFAVYPPALCETPIKASCPPKVCADCGAPYEREVDREPGEYDYSDRDELMSDDAGRKAASGTQTETPTAEFKGWSQTCDCDTDATESGIVLDPFAGAGTTLLKAKELGRRFVGIELNPEYADMARSRVGLDVDDPSRFRDDDAQQGFEAYQ